jgi:t-SNARE complex subunit (syntaxin)
MKLYEQLKKQWIINNPYYTQEEYDEFIKNLVKMLKI